jgi:hypothetical protein
MSAPRKYGDELPDSLHRAARRGERRTRQGIPDEGFPGPLALTTKGRDVVTALPDLSAEDS